MPDNYKITPEQEAILAKYTCERLRDDKYNEDLIQDFFSYRGEGLVNSLQSKGWDSDRNGTIAYYVVKNEKGKIVLFFSLKCGVLYPADYFTNLTTLQAETETLRNAMAGAEAGDQDCREYLEEEKERLGEAEYARRTNNIDYLSVGKNAALGRIYDDIFTTGQNDVIRVDETHAAVELVDFCVNDVTKRTWPLEQMGNKKLGRTMFWHFIIPRIVEINKMVGCEYVYLFAADRADGRLVRFYRNKLHFIEPVRFRAVKPRYDMECVLMCKHLFSGKRTAAGPADVVEEDEDEWGLDSYRVDFFDNFNKPDPVEE